MAYGYVQSRQHAGVGAEAETTFYTEWNLSCGLFPRMRLRNAWDSRACIATDVVVPTALSILGDDDRSGFISDLDYSPSGRLLVASSSSNSLYVLDPNLGSVVKTLYKPHKDAISKVRFVGEYQFVSGSADSTVGYWDIRSPSRALNFLQSHNKPIRSLHYFPDAGYLVSSCQDGTIRFRYLPSCVATDSNDQDGGDNLDHLQGLILKCSNLNQCFFSEFHEMAVISNHSGTIFIIRNLSVPHLNEDLGNTVFDDTSQMQLCWFKPNALRNKRNRVAVVESCEYSPVGDANISNMAHVSLHPSFPVALLRITTSKPTYVSREVKDWTCVCRMSELPCTTSHELGMYMQMFGSNIMEGMLLYATEETRYASFREKQPSFSMCGRVIATPDSGGVRLMKFSPNMGTCVSPVTVRKNPCEMDSLFFAGDWPTGPTSLELITHLPGPQKSVLCCKFSPRDNSLLAVGDLDAQINFYNPKL